MRLKIAESFCNSHMQRTWVLLIWWAASFHLGYAHWHEEWAEGATFRYAWYLQPWVAQVTEFYCDEMCDARLSQASTIDREIKALVDLFNQTTGAPRDVYRGAFEGLDEFKAATNPALLSRRQASLNQWKRSAGWDSIIDAHTSTLTLCTSLKLDGNVTFSRSLCYENIDATAQGPLFPDPAWSVIEDCCLKFNRTVSACSLNPMMSKSVSSTLIELPPRRRSDTSRTPSSGPTSTTPTALAMRLIPTATLCKDVSW